jgi:hypothetical protein
MTGGHEVLQVVRPFVPAYLANMTTPTPPTP